MILLSTTNEEWALTYLGALEASGSAARDTRVWTGGAVAPAMAGVNLIVLCGGEDVEPQRYGQPKWNETVLPNPERDAREFALLEAARGAAVPVFGICRGVQVLNVFLGGSLWQDLPSQRGSAIRHSVMTTRATVAHVVIPAPSLPDHPFAAALRRTLEREPRVNSRHHQAIRDLGEGLEPLAFSPDGLLEAVALRDADRWWAAGVQWHPENLVSALPGQEALWSAVLEAAPMEVLR
jgi:putative glutamine amidotransferase